MPFNSSLHPPTGFHLSLSSSVDDLSGYLNEAKSLHGHTHCSLYALHSFPPSFIIDRYQLEQLQADGTLGTSLTATGNASPCFVLQANTDLENPVFTVRNDVPGRLALRLANWNLETADIEEIAPSFQWDVPIHARYVAPSTPSDDDGTGGSSHRKVDLQWPNVFFACMTRVPEDACRPPSYLSSNPKSVLGLGQSLESSDSGLLQFLATVEAWIGSDNSLYFVPPLSKLPEEPASSSLPPTTAMIPTGNVDDFQTVRIVQAIITWLAFWYIWRQVLRDHFPIAKVSPKKQSREVR